MKIEEIYSGGAVGTTYLFLQSPAVLLAYFAYKLNDSWFKATEATEQSGEVAFFGSKITSHQMSNSRMGGGVCVLGKWVAGLIFFQALLSIGILYGVNTGTPKDKDTILGVCITNIILMFALLIGASIMNASLSFRSIPFYVMQAGIIIYLMTIYFLLKKVEQLQESNAEQLQESNAACDDTASSNTAIA